MRKLIILFALLCISQSVIFAESDKSGTIGDNLKWKIDDYGVLTVSGTGPMKLYTSDMWDGYSKVIIEEGVTTIDNFAFGLDGAVTSVELPSTLKTIGGSAFSGCKLKNINFPESLTDIKASAFENNPLEQITFCDNLKTIGSNAFNSSRVKELSFPLSLELISDGAFAYSEDLESVVFPDKNPLTIKERAFLCCDMLKKIEIPANVSLEGAVFLQCNGLVEVTFGEGTKSISKDAFASSGLEKITLPKSVTHIERDAFFGCPLTDIYYDGTPESWKAIQIDDGNEDVKNATVHFLGESYSEVVEDTDSDTEKIQIQPIENSQDISVILNGNRLLFDQPPVIRDDRVFVPIRAIAEGMTANVEYANGSVYIKGDGVELSLDTSGSHYYQLNGMENCILDSAPFILNDRTLVPVRVVAQSFSCDVQWDSANKTVIINRIEKGNYDKYKVDKEKPLVVDAMCYEYKETHYKIPKLNIKGTVADEINNRILLERAGNISEIKNVHEQGYDSGCWRETYTYSVYGNILSVLTAVYYDGGTVIHKTINYDMENDKELSFDDVMTLCGVDKNEHIMATHDKCAELYDRVWGYTLNMGWMTEELYYNNRAMAKTEECYSEKSQLYITDSGCVMSIIDFPSLAGAGSYEYLYDAGLKISMTEIKK